MALRGFVGRGWKWMQEDHITDALQRAGKSSIDWLSEEHISDALIRSKKWAWDNPEYEGQLGGRLVSSSKVVEEYNKGIIDREEADAQLGKLGATSISKEQGRGKALSDAEWNRQRLLLQYSTGPFGGKGRPSPKHGRKAVPGLDYLVSGRGAQRRASRARGAQARSALVGQGIGGGLNRRRKLSTMTMDERRDFLGSRGFNVPTLAALKAAEQSYVRRGAKGAPNFNRKAARTGQAGTGQAGLRGFLEAAAPGGMTSFIQDRVSPGSPGAPGGAAGVPTSGTPGAAEGDPGLPEGTTAPGIELPGTGQDMTLEQEAAAATAKIFDPLELLEAADVSQAYTRRGSRLRQLTTRQKGLNKFMKDETARREGIDSDVLARQMAAEARREGAAGPRESQAMSGATAALAAQQSRTAGLFAGLEASSRLGGQRRRQRQQTIEDQNIQAQKRELIELRAQRGQFEFETTASMRDRRDALAQQEFQNQIATGTLDLARDQFGLDVRQVDFAEEAATSAAEAGPSEIDEATLRGVRLSNEAKWLANEESYWDLQEKFAGRDEDPEDYLQAKGTTGKAVHDGAIDVIDRLETIINDQSPEMFDDPYAFSTKIMNTIDSYLQGQGLELGDPTVWFIRNELIRGRLIEFGLSDAGFSIDGKGALTAPPQDTNE